MNITALYSIGWMMPASGNNMVTVVTRLRFLKGERIMSRLQVVARALEKLGVEPSEEDPEGRWLDRVVVHRW